MHKTLLDVSFKISSAAKKVVEKMLVPKFAYPLAQRDESKMDEYHGKKIANPYHWLEDPDSDKTAKYVGQLNCVTKAYIDQCPIKDKIHAELKNFLDYPKYGCPRKEGSNYFYSYNTGLQNQSVLYKQERLDAEPTVFLDPNLLSKDGTTSVTLKSFTEDGSLLAYGLSEKGSDWVTVKFKRTVDGSDLPDKLEHLRYSGLDWTNNNKGVFYARYPEDNTGEITGKSTTKNEFQRLFYHYLGTDQSKDILCADFPENPNYMIGFEVTEDGKFLILSIDKGCDPANLVYYVDLSAIKNDIREKLNLLPIIDSFESKFNFISNDGHIFTFLTDYNAPLFQLVQIDAKNPAKENWKILAKEEKSKLDWAVRVNGDYLVLCYLEDVKSRLHVHDFKSGKRLFSLPLDIGSVANFSGKMKHSEIFYTFQSFLTPCTMYRLDFSSKEKEAKVHKQVMAKGTNYEDYQIDQVFYSSKDGTKVPMFIVHKKGLKLDGNNPTLMYGYGGFNVSMLPYFSGLRAFFVRHFDGVVAIPNIRGGDEYGKTWHEEGMKEKKQNVFDDFIAAGEYLINKKYTCRDKFAVQGHSNGGLLVAACANQRPDLFGCVLNHVGVMDMLRYQNFTIGEAWVPEFGSSADEKYFDVLLKYSPLHNIRAPKDDEPYPAMLLSTADHDDRVVPSHSLKFIAQLYYQTKDIEIPRNPLLIRVEVQAGHGAGKPTSKIIDEAADVYAFVFNVLGLKWSN